ncbi:hypothetical protein BKA64DRAFT_736714 [Cadophora sp. MPI-SDFR-AT-0126]|nr:hypothetical protein BKA64DRAFT_736714 [Leotiomycetes sp. MPI-SDFR-AT-0126]
MAPTILMVGATGNTGRGATKTLSKLLQNNDTHFSGHRILALTRSRNSAAAQELAKLPNVEVEEYNWVEITASWFRQKEVVRAFIASHNQSSQFAEESSFHLAALRAGVEYVVRISTTAANVRADCDAFYPRSHWAIEAMLSDPEFSRLKWSLLQPNVFSPFYLAPAADLIKKYHETGKQETLRLMGSENAPVGILDPEEVGVFAAHLLSQQDVSEHNKAKYVLNGPEDISGAQIVKLVEEYIGTKVEDVSYADMTFIDGMAESAEGSKTLILSIKHAPDVANQGKCTASTTSKNVLKIAAPSRTPREVLKTLLEE